MTTWREEKKKPIILKILNYSKVQADIEKLLIPMNSTKKMGKKILNTHFWTIHFMRSGQILKSVSGITFEKICI